MHEPVSSPLDITPFIALLLVASLVAMIAQRVRIPYALALVVTGLVIGAPHLLPNVHLEPHTLFTVFLPPLLFEAALALRVDALRRNWLPILVYAVGGTLVSAGIVGALAAWLLGLPLVTALLFGALISPTDPISVIAVFKRLGVGRRLSLVVEAESLFNDGVAVVLFGLLLAAAEGARVTPVGTVQQFSLVVFGGAAVGFAIGGIASRVTAYFDDHLLEIMLTTIVAFGSYLCAEALHVSGVIAVVTAGLVVGNYGMRTGMSPTTRLAVGSFWEYAAFAANSIVFLLVGIEVTFYNLWGRVGAVVAGIAMVLAGRAVAIYGLSLLVNGLRGGVPRAWQHVLFWGGLRGALSMALVLGLRPDFPDRELLVILTFGIVLFSLLAQGLTIAPLLRRLGLCETAASESRHRLLAGDALAGRAGLRELEQLRAAGRLPTAVYQPLKVEYDARLEELEREIQELYRTDESLGEQQVGETRRLALIAEKSALRDAERDGLLDEEETRRLLERIDHALASSPGRTAAGAGQETAPPPPAP